MDDSEKSVFVSRVFIKNRAFQPHIVKTVKSTIPAVSLNIVHDFTLFVADIHQIMLISLFPTLFDHFHPFSGLIL